MKSNLLILFFLLLGLGAHAEEWALVVSHQDGKRSVFLLNDKPEMTISGGDCVFQSQVSRISISRKNIADFHFERVADGIGDVRAEETRYEFVGEATLCITNVKPDAVHVYDVNGKAVEADMKATGQSVTVSLQQLPQGIYIVRYAGNAIKILKK